MRSHSQALNSNDVFDDDYHHKKMDWAFFRWEGVWGEEEKSISHDAPVTGAEIGVRS